MSILFSYSFYLNAATHHQLISWNAITHPIQGDPEVIGSTSNGCIIGAKPLPLFHSHYQVMRSNKRHYYGHPQTIAFIQHLASLVKQQQLGVMLIGDLAQPAGGKSIGHASHQNGLDVDIWLQLPKQPWTRHQLLHPIPINLVAQDDKHVNQHRWHPEIEQLIYLAANDKHVARIFVNPAIKLALCRSDRTGTHQDWLRKIRPWFGHKAHMHIRLHCPLDNHQCEEQPAPPLGDGCGEELLSWFNPSPVASAKNYQKKIIHMHPVCRTIIEQKSKQR